VQVIETAQEKQVRILFNDFKRIGDAANPECILDGVDLVAPRWTGENRQFVDSAKPAISAGRDQ
jgi:hypothetical protein